MNEEELAMVNDIATLNGYTRANGEGGPDFVRWRNALGFVVLIARRQNAAVAIRTLVQLRDMPTASPAFGAAPLKQEGANVRYD